MKNTTVINNSVEHVSLVNSTHWINGVLYGWVTWSVDNENALLVWSML